jgi:PA domain
MVPLAESARRQPDAKAHDRGRGAAHHPAGGDAGTGRRRGRHQAAAERRDRRRHHGPRARLPADRNQNGGTRASGTPGYDASAAYVADRLEAAGYEVTEQEFTFPFYRELQPAELEQVSPTPTVYQTGTYDFSGSGEVTGVVVPTNDVVIPPNPTPPPNSTSGCEPGDFTPAPAEAAVALIQRGTCTFEDKANNAIAAGYDAVILFNEGNPGRTDLFIGTLAPPSRSRWSASASRTAPRCTPRRWPARWSCGWRP